MDSTTLVDDRDRKEQRPEERRPFLFVVLQADQPLPASSRHALNDVDEVHLCRGEVRTAVRKREGNTRQLVLMIPDRWMSTRHAVLRRKQDRWQLEDLDSKNGTWLDGERVRSKPLTDSTSFELGHTFLVFRIIAARAGEREPDITDAQLRPPLPSLTTFSPGLEEAFTRLADVAKSTLPVLLGGETGTGKEVVARAVHEISRRDGAFVAVNCGALPPNLVESELFGFRRGSFSGALEDRVGLVRSADEGTLFLDEIGDLPAAAQAPLLRVIQEREVVPIGTVKPLSVNLRFVAATHHDLDAAMRGGSFRSDLLARLSGFHLCLPPLRERREDLAILIRAILRKIQTPPEAVSFSADAVRALMTHTWLRNIRELEHRLRLAVVLAKGGPIHSEHLFHPDSDPSALESDESRLADMRTGAPAPNMTEADMARRNDLVTQLRRHQGNVSAVARAMGKTRMQIHRWMKRYGIDRRQLP